MGRETIGAIEYLKESLWLYDVSLGIRLEFEMREA